MLTCSAALSTADTISFNALGLSAVPNLLSALAPNLASNFGSITNGLAYLLSGVANGGTPPTGPAVNVASTGPLSLATALLGASAGGLGGLLFALLNGQSLSAQALNGSGRGFTLGSTNQESFLQIFLNALNGDYANAGSNANILQAVFAIAVSVFVGVATFLGNLITGLITGNIDLATINNFSQSSSTFYALSGVSPN